MAQGALLDTRAVERCLTWNYASGVADNEQIETIREFVAGDTPPSRLRVPWSDATG